MIAFDLAHMRIESLNRGHRMGMGQTLQAMRRQRFGAQSKAKNIRTAGYWALLNRAPRATLRAVVAATERLAVTLTRIGPGQLDDDNLSAGFKPLRDGIADALELNDRDPRLRWLYAQQRTRKTYSVRVTLEPMTKAQLVARVAALEEART